MLETAGAIGGGLVSRPRHSRMLRSASGAWLAHTILCGHRSDHIDYDVEIVDYH